MSARQSMSGMVQVEITGADILESLAVVNRQGISLSRIRMTGQFSAELTLSRGDYRRLKSILNRRGDRTVLKERIGFYWTIKSMLRRPVLVLGLLGLLIFSLWLPRRVFFVQVEGNTTLPDRQILESARRCGIEFGALREDVRSERVKNALLEQIPQLQWAGVNTDGCVAKISVREHPPEESSGAEHGLGHIIAVVDGVVLSATATRGTLLCAPGQAVCAGDILISGYTDCGLTIRAEQAEGEIYARTNRSIQAISPLPVCRMLPSEKEMKKFSLLIGKKRIKLWKDSGIYDVTCDRMYEEYYVTLPGGFQLPLALSVETFRERKSFAAEDSAEKASRFLAEFAREFLKKRMLAGEILAENTVFESRDNWLVLDGRFACREMIGFIQRQQIGDHNGKND